MKIVCSKSDLNNGLGIVLKAVPSKTSMSILFSILFKAENNRITLTANNDELYIETIVEGEIIDEGSAAIDAKFISEIVRKLPDSDVVIDVDENYVTTIKCENSKFNLISKNPLEYPSLPLYEKIDSIILSDFVLRDIIKQTIFCLADNNQNQMMCSELFHIKDDVLKVVALDGYRIAYRMVNLKNTYNEKKVIIPGRSLNEISRILEGDSEKDVVMYFSKNNVVFELENTTVITKIVEGQYFNYEQMLNFDYETKVVINKKEFYESVDRGTLLLREGEVKPIVIDVEDTKINVSISTNVGNMDENVFCEKTGKDISIALRPKFILDVLKTLEEENINVYMINSKSPFIIRNDDNSYIYFILPINVTKGN